MQFFWRSIWAAIWLCLSAASAVANDVRLTSRDGAIQIEGTLLTYDGEFYRVETIYGPLTLDGQGVTCDGPGCPDLNAFVANIRLSGTDRMAEVLIPALIQAFAIRNGYSVIREVKSDRQSTFALSDQERLRARFQLSSGTTSEGYADLIAEEADIALVLREPRKSEVSMARTAAAGDLLKGRRARVVALDGVVAITAPGQPLRSISLEQMASAISGQTARWSDIGGADIPIIRHLPKRGSGLLETFEDRVLRPSKLTLNDGATHHAFLEDLSDRVADDTFAIGLTTLSEIGNTIPLKVAGSCGFETSATLAALRAEDYPLTLPLMLYTPARRLPLIAREFLDFTQDPAADLVIRRAGFIDQAITKTRFDDQGDRLAHAISQAGPEVTLEDLQTMVGALRDRDRLSTTFRFTGGTRLDVQSQENIIRLARALETGAFNDQDLLLAGFSDGEGPAGPNLALSKKRARTVLRLLKETAPDADFKRVTLATEAFGEALPMACDDTDWGRAINRRVEVWVK
ncbi:phosphate ABC transporter substrate-binding protein (PhoT family) [Litoreibacter meonggei]|uniref:Phosphate ABC transporter substrate-binding protein (PhoT family) n=1 Tax=Litoreibacter meonggei TaxID=1049199 RepID=A0A497WQ21_9RHOB|nr:phosphate ABC transporter substrate-binding/OmpA family protein [Litoreibacter meonggei]RLJ52059.1 phosphate ABC transporter substrate-binding protein (PhoT family) [Litoreibacter meonggei]